MKKTTAETISAPDVSSSSNASSSSGASTSLPQPSSSTSVLLPQLTSPQTSTSSSSPSPQPSSSSTSADDAPLLYQYKARDIQAILSCCNIATRYQVPLPLDESEQYALMFHAGMSFSNDTFLLENIDYYLKCSGQCQPRRVAFLFYNDHRQQFNAVIIQMSDINDHTSQQIQEKITSNTINTVEGVMKNQQLIALFRLLYKKVECLYIGKSADESLRRLLQQPLQNAFQLNIHVNCLPFSELSFASNSGLVITEYLKEMLNKGVTYDIDDLQAVLATHHQLCVKGMSQWFHQLQQKNSKQHRKITKLFEVLFKYVCLHQFRQQANTKYAADSSLEACARLREEVIHHKKTLYRVKVNVEKMLTILGFETLAPLLCLQHDHHRIKEALNKERERYQSLSQKWDAALDERIADLKKNWINYLSWMGRRTARYLYTHSFVGLGAELFQLAGNVISMTKAGEILDYIIKKPLQLGTRVAIAAFTFSDAVIRKHRLEQTDHASKKNHSSFIRQPIKKTAHVVIARWGLTSREATRRRQGFQKITSSLTFPRLSKVIGFGSGLLITYVLGPYSLFRMLLIGEASRIFLKVMRRERINDKKATFTVSKNHFTRPKVAVRTTILALSSFEALYTWDARCFLHAGGGMLTQSGFVNFANYCLTDKPYPSGKSTSSEIPKPPSEKKILLLFMLSMAGMELGRYATSKVTSTYIHIQRKIQSQAAAKDALYEGLTRTKVTLPKIISSPSLWFNDENSMTVDRVDVLEDGCEKHTVYQCHIVDDDSNEVSGKTICEKISEETDNVFCRDIYETDNGKIASFPSLRGV